MPLCFCTSHTHVLIYLFAGERARIGLHITCKDEELKEVLEKLEGECDFIVPNDVPVLHLPEDESCKESLKAYIIVACLVFIIVVLPVILFGEGAYACGAIDTVNRIVPYPIVNNVLVGIGVSGIDRYGQKSDIDINVVGSIKVAEDERGSCAVISVYAGYVFRCIVSFIVYVFGNIVFVFVSEGRGSDIYTGGHDINTYPENTKADPVATEVVNRVEARVATQLRFKVQPKMVQKSCVRTTFVPFWLR